jgi:hypothetical protein
MEQLAFDVDALLDDTTSPPVAGRPGLKKNAQAGAPRLLRTLLARGLDPDALGTAAGLVALLDADAHESIAEAA